MKINPTSRWLLGDCLAERSDDLDEQLQEHQAKEERARLEKEKEEVDRLIKLIWAEDGEPLTLEMAALPPPEGAPK